MPSKKNKSNSQDLLIDSFISSMTPYHSVNVSGGHLFPYTPFLFQGTSTVSDESNGKKNYLLLGKRPQLVDVETGVAVRELPKDTVGVTPVGFFRGGAEEVYALYPDGKSTIFNLAKNTASSFLSLTIASDQVLVAATQIPYKNRIIALVHSHTSKKVSLFSIDYSTKKAKNEFEYKYKDHEVLVRDIQASNHESHPLVVMAFEKAVVVIDARIWRVKKRYTFDTAVSAVAIHPHTHHIAVGDITGRIHLIYPSATATISIMHWHAHRVNSLCFAPDGGHSGQNVTLLSGGEEGVLVLWDLSTSGGGDKQFLPRLGAEIEQVIVSPDMSTYIVCLRNNSVIAVSAVGMQIKCRVKGVMLAGGSQKTEIVAGVTYHPATDSVVLNGYESSLQFYSLGRDMGLFETDISLRNKLYKKDHSDFGSQTMYPLATSVKFLSQKSATPEWMITLDERPARFEEGVISSLKFWNWVEPDTQETRGKKSSSGYRLFSRFDSAHEGKITSLDAARVSRPSNMATSKIDGELADDYVVATMGDDHTLKLWSLVRKSIPVDPSKSTGADSMDVDGIASPETLLEWETISSMKIQAKSGSAQRACLSPDGSLIAIYGPETSTVQLRKLDDLESVTYISIKSLANGMRLRDVRFMGDLEHLVLVFDKRLVVWNLISGAVSWAIDMSIDNLATSSDTPVFAVTTRSTSPIVIIFKGNSPVPQTLYPLDSISYGICFQPTSVNTLPDILVLTESFQFVRLSAAPSLASGFSTSSPLIREKSKSIFTRLFGSAFSSEQPPSIDQSGNDLYRQANVTSFSQVPSHIFEVSWDLCERFMETSLGRA